MLAALLIFASLTLAGYAIAQHAGARQEVKRMLQRRITTMTGLSQGVQRGAVLKDRRLSAISVLNTWIPRIGMVTPLIRMVGRAGLKKRVGEVLLYVPLAACAGYVVVTLTTGNAPFAALAGAVGGMVPLVLVRRMARRRSLLFAEQLPDALD